MDDPWGSERLLWLMLQSDQFIIVGDLARGWLGWLELSSWKPGETRWFKVVGRLGWGKSGWPVRTRMVGLVSRRGDRLE